MILRPSTKYKKLTVFQESSTLSVLLLVKEDGKMALTEAHWYTVYQLVDTGGKIVTRRWEQSAPADDAAARASALAMATDLAAITDCVIVAYYTYQVFEEDALSLPAAAEAEMQALINVSIDGEPLKNATITVPAPVDGIFSGATGANYDIVDGADEDLVAFLANFGSEALFYVSDGEQMDVFKNGHRRHMKSIRG